MSWSIESVRRSYRYSIVWTLVLAVFNATMDLSEECIDDYASLTSEAGEYVFENGRRYHGYKSGRVFSTSLYSTDTDLSRIPNAQ